MADGVAITAGSGTTIATDDVGGVHYQRVKLVDGTLDGTGAIGGDATNGLDVDVTRMPGTAAEGAALPSAFVVVAGDDGTDTQPIQLSATGDLKVTLDSETVQLAASTNNIGDVDVLSMPAVQTYGTTFSCSTDITRPADTTAYAVNDALSDSTSAPTSGGFTFTSAARQSGGSGIILGAMICTSNDAGTLLQGEIIVFNQSVTNVNDNAAFAVSDSEIKTFVCKIPFTLEDMGNNGAYYVPNLNYPFTCVGTANLRFLVRVKNAYTPASAEVITVRIDGVQTT